MDYKDKFEQEFFEDEGDRESDDEFRYENEDENEEMRDSDEGIDIDENEFTEITGGETMINEEDLYEEKDNMLDFGTERVFKEKNQTARYGSARLIDVDEDLGTILGDSGRLDKLNARLNRTPDEVFRSLAYQFIQKNDIKDSKGVFESVLRIQTKINRQNKRLRYKSPKLVVLASMCMTDNGTEISKNLLNTVYEDYGKSNNITKSDILRYAFFIIDLN